MILRLARAVEQMLPAALVSMVSYGHQHHQEVINEDFSKDRKQERF
jgi:hypothetical protein